MVLNPKVASGTGLPGALRDVLGFVCAVGAFGMPDDQKMNVNRQFQGAITNKQTNQILESDYLNFCGQISHLDPIKIVVCINNHR